MALVIPPYTDSERPRPLDPVHVCLIDPGQVIGVRIALGAAPRKNGCMELITGSQLCSAVLQQH
jgi:hypothetical protein